MYDFATASFCTSTSAGSSLSWLYDFGLGGGAALDAAAGALRFSLYSGFGGLLPPRPANMYDFATASFCTSTSAGSSLSWLYDFGLGGSAAWMLLQVHFDFLCIVVLVAYCHQDLQTCMTSPRASF